MKIGLFFYPAVIVVLSFELFSVMADEKYSTAPVTALPGTTDAGQGDSAWVNVANPVEAANNSYDPAYAGKCIVDFRGRFVANSQIGDSTIIEYTSPGEQAAKGTLCGTGTLFRVPTKDVILWMKRSIKAIHDAEGR